MTKYDFISFISIQHSKLYMISDIIFCALLILSLVSTNEADYQFTITRPILPKKIIHESGNYYLRYNRHRKLYELSKDFLIIRIIIHEISASNIDVNSVGPEGVLISYIKNFLDSKYSEKVAKIELEKKRINIIYKLDGYTSDATKRDNKIKKII